MSTLIDLYFSVPNIFSNKYIVVTSVCMWLAFTLLWIYTLFNFLLVCGFICMYNVKARNMHWHCDFLWTCLLSWLIVLPWLIFISRDHKIDRKKVISIVHVTRVFNILWKPFWFIIYKKNCYLGPLRQSLVVNCLNQKGVIEVVNLVDFKRYHEKVDLSND